MQGPAGANVKELNQINHAKLPGGIRFYMLWLKRLMCYCSVLYPISTSSGKVYVAQVKERATARKIYDAAKKQGKTAGLVATKLVF